MDTRYPIRRALVGAALFLLLNVAIKVLAPHYLSADGGDRLAGVLMGALVVVFANAVPKSLAPLANLRCDPAREQALRRFTGWALVGGGIAFGLASALAPMDIKNTVAAGLLGIAVAAVVARCVWARRSQA
jgi:small-conductance mechanosensitive channel